jgi:hypothetical protein
MTANPGRRARQALRFAAPQIAIGVAWLARVTCQWRAWTSASAVGEHGASEITIPGYAADQSLEVPVGVSARSVEERRDPRLAQQMSQTQVTG